MIDTKELRRAIECIRKGNWRWDALGEQIGTIDAVLDENDGRRRLEEHLVVRYSVSFPNYAYTGPDAAIDLMAAEITTLWVEKRRLEYENDALRAKLDVAKCGPHAFNCNARWDNADLMGDPLPGTCDCWKSKL